MAWCLLKTLFSLALQWPHHTSNVLSFKIDTEQFSALLNSLSPTNKARLLSASAPEASSWLSVVPTVELGFHHEPHEFCVGIR